MKNKKVLALILTALLATSTLSSCSNSEGDTKSTTATTKAGADVVETTTAEPEPEGNELYSIWYTALTKLDLIYLWVTGLM